MPGPSFAEALKGGSFGKEAKDSQESFELRLKAPGKMLQVTDVIAAVKARTVDPKTFFGLRREHQDLIASFHSKVERNLLLGHKSIKVKGVEVFLSQFPPAHTPLSSGFRSALSQVPMTATGSAIAKAVAPLTPLNFIIEKYRGTQVRTGRVILWTPSAPKVNSVYVNGTEVALKHLDKLEKKDTEADTTTTSESTSAPPKKNGTKKGNTKENSAGVKDPLTASTAPVVDMTPKKTTVVDMDLTDPRTPINQPEKERSTKKRKLSPLKPTPITADIPKWNKATFEATGIPVPPNHSILSIYEKVKTRDDVVRVRKEVPSPLKNSEKLELEFERNDTSGLLDTLVFSTMREEDPDYDAIEKIYRDLEPDIDYLYTEKGWLQKVFVTPDIVVLVIYKTRIAEHARTQRKSK